MNSSKNPIGVIENSLHNIQLKLAEISARLDVLEKTVELAIRLAKVKGE